MEYFIRVLGLNPYDAKVWNNLGYTYEEIGKHKEAASAYQKALSLDSFQEEAHFNLARIEYLQNQSSLDDIEKEEIIRRLHYVMSVNPRHTQAGQLLKKLETQIIEKPRDNP